jgi:demethylspheroidene O-methyltransferase
MPSEKPWAAIRERWHQFRNNLVASPAFRDKLAAFPLTKPIARRQARALFDLCAGFVYSQILAACVASDLFNRLRAGPQPVAALAEATGLGSDGLLRLVDGAVALGLLERHPRNRVGLALLGAAMIDNPGIEQMVRHHGMLYEDLSDPIALLTRQAGQTRLNRFWAYAGDRATQDLGADDVRAYSDLMAVSQSLVANEILGAYDFGQHRCLLDVGGGDGSFIRAVAARHPQLSLMLFDLPPVAELARARCDAAGLSDRVATVPGSFLSDPLPEGADVISLVRIVHDHDDPDANRLLQRCRAALAPGGRLVLAEPMAATPGAETVGDAYFGFYLLAMGKGRPRSAEALEAMLRDAGFASIQRRATHLPLQTRVLVARV